MANSPIPVAVHAEVFGDGVIITFDNGKCAVYPMALLHSMFPLAEEIFESDYDE